MQYQITYNLATFQIGANNSEDAKMIAHNMYHDELHIMVKEMPDTETTKDISPITPIESTLPAKPPIESKPPIEPMPTPQVTPVNLQNQDILQQNQDILKTSTYLH